MLGHQVATALDGPAALTTAEGFRPEVILLDIGLPGMDGYEVARRLRSSQTEQPVIVAVTGYGQEEDRRRSREAGFDHHFVKPVDPQALSRLLSSLSRRRSRPHLSKALVAVGGREKVRDPRLRRESPDRVARPPRLERGTYGLEGRRSSS